MMDSLSNCPNPAETVLMPSAQFSFDVSRKPDRMTQAVAADVNRGFATFAAFGRIDYEDSRGKNFSTLFCALYIQDIQKFNTCAYGNEAR
jgi:hypothetical protein